MIRGIHLTAISCRDLERPMLETFPARRTAGR